MSTRLFNARDSEAVLKIVDKHLHNFKAYDVATAFHRIAARNKHKRARRDILLRDERLERLFDAAVEQASNFSARCVADVLWSMATLGHFPSRLLLPVLTSVNTHLERDDFQGKHLAQVVWAFAKLTTKPTRLLERIEVQAITRLEGMNMQNCANMLWGFATLGYKPASLLPHMMEALLKPGMLDNAKHVEVADIGFALGTVAAPGECNEVLRALAGRAAPDATLRDLSSRQICMLIDTFATLEATAELPVGLLDAWIAIVKIAHAETPLMARDARKLEESLGMLGVDAAWVQKSEMLTEWLKQMESRPAATAKTATSKYSDEELRKVFDAIDVDGSGDIDLDELTAAAGKVGANIDDEMIKRMMTFGATSGEMSVTFDEFTQIMTGATAQKRMEVV